MEEWLDPSRFSSFERTMERGAGLGSAQGPGNQAGLCDTTAKSAIFRRLQLGRAAGIRAAANES